MNGTAMIEQEKSPVRILQWGMLGGRGGIEMFIMNLYRAIDRSKVQFDFLNAHNQAPYPLEEEIRDLGGRVFRVQYSQREAPFTAQSRLRRFYEEHPEIAGVHVNANFPYAAPLVAAKKAHVGLRILHSHNSMDAARLAGSNSLRRLKATIHDCAVRHDIDHVPTHYFACSEKAADYMFPGKPYLWVRNGIDTQTFAFSEKTRAEVRADLGLPSEITVIGFCGRLREQKNPLFAMDVYASYHAANPKSVFMVVGDGELMEPMREHAAASGVLDSVLFMGGERDDVSRLYQAMDAFVLPSRFEGLGMVYIEAQCAGLPCLAPEDNVPLEAKASDLMTYVPRSYGAEDWAVALDRQLSRRNNRSDGMRQVRQAGYEMSDVAKQLEKFYLSHIGSR